MESDNLISHLRSLGLVAQVSNEDELAAHLNSGTRTLYCGFDPTADSLHAGNLIPLLALRRFQIAGHRPILLIGGATGMIGDPGGRTTERQLNSAEVVADYVEKIKEQASRFLDFDCGSNSAVLVDNADWTRGMTVIDFLRDVGRHFSVNAMIQKESVRRRLEQDESGISYTEFSYMVMQSYDFVVLNERFECTLQIGGNDQWGNITSGMDLIRKMAGKQAFAMTYPLMLNADGSKFGKSTAGAIWLDEEKTSPYAFYQFWLNCSDTDVVDYIKYFTFVDDEERSRLVAAHQQDPGMRVAHMALAKEVTRLVHGEAGLQSAERITEAMFTNRIGILAEEDLRQLSLDGLPSTRVATAEAGLADLLVESGLAVTPRGEVTLGQAKKLIKSKAVSVNGEKTDDIAAVLSPQTALFGCFHILQRGKKNHHLVEWIDVK